METLPSNSGSLNCYLDQVRRFWNNCFNNQSPLLTQKKYSRKLIEIFRVQDLLWPSANHCHDEDVVGDRHVRIQIREKFRRGKSHTIHNNHLL